MGLDSFNRLDIVARDPEAPESGVRVIIVNGRGWDGPDEALLTVQAMVKFSRLLPYAEQQTQAGTPTRLELLNFGEPPDTLLRWLNARGVTNETRQHVDDAGWPSRGRPAAFPADAEGLPALDPLMEANAERFAEQRGLPWPPAMEGLEALDGVLEARRTSVGLGPEDHSEDIDDGDLVVMAGAYAGEITRREFGGRWKLDPQNSTPLTLSVGEEKRQIVVNFPGKVVKYLCYGAEDSVRSLVSAVRAHIRHELRKA